jgi:hypothetical protein
MQTTQLNDNRFDPTVFKNGNELEHQQQMLNWINSGNNSIFVHWVPDQMLPRDDNFPSDLISRDFFGRFGAINRIDFVPKVNNTLGVISGHMVFVHYDYFFNNSGFIQQIACSYPEPVEDEISFGKYSYKLRCSINTHPIPKVVEYNPSQISDMINNLNMRLENDSKLKDSKIDQLVIDNQLLRQELQEFKDRVLKSINL